MNGVLFYTLGVDLPSTKFRVYQYEDYFLARKIRFDVRHIGGKSNREKRRLFAQAGEYDVVVLQKKLLGTYWLRLLKTYNRNICFDFDDALYAKESFVARKKAYRPGTLLLKKKLHTTLRNVACVFAGNKTLGDYAGRFNSNVEIVPTPVDTTVYRYLNRSAPDKNFRIGWIGTSKNQFYLARIIPEIAGFLETHPKVSLHIMSDKNLLGLTHERILFSQWTPSAEIELLENISVGLMPLTDDEWSRGKCAFKALQYMATGLPVIASDVGMNAEVIQHGVNGMLANEGREWADFLMQLSDKKRRARIGRAARATVVESYSVEKWAPKVCSLLASIAVTEGCYE